MQKPSSIPATLVSLVRKITSFFFFSLTPIISSSRGGQHRAYTRPDSPSLDHVLSSDTWSAAPSLAFPREFARHNSPNCEHLHAVRVPTPFVWPGQASRASFYRCRCMRGYSPPRKAAHGNVRCREPPPH